MKEQHRDLRKKNLTFLIEIIQNDAQGLCFEGASDDEIRRVEDRLGVKLPVTFVVFLKSCNGASLYHDSIEIFATKSTIPELQIDLVAEKERMSYLPANLIPFAHTASFYYFDMKQQDGDEYAVVEWDEKTQQTVKTYKSFAEWLQKEVIEVINPELSLPE